MNQKQVFYIHGGSAYSDYNKFLTHLKESEMRYPHGDRPELWGKRIRQSLPECEVFTPQMPNSQNAKYEEWKIWFERHFEFLRDGVVLVGWSQGAYFLLKYLIENDAPFTIQDLILVASPVKPEDFGGEDGGDFNFDAAKLPAIAAKVGHIDIFHSEDDFVVPYEHAKELQVALPEATLHTFTDRNHFLQEEFPELIELIQNVP